MSLDQLAADTANRFSETYGRKPRWIAAAPGRVNIIGEHTDYNDGYVLPMAIECYTVLAADRAAASASSPPSISLHDTRLNETALIPIGQPMARGEPKWSNYVRGVIAGFQRRGEKIPPLQVLMASTVPLGGGLSSSAALEVSTATLLEAVTGRPLDPVDKALLCQKAEHEFAGVPCGIMDQFTSVFGRRDNLLLLDCRSQQTELVPMTDAAVSVLIINTNVKHELSGGEYAERRRQCEEAARILGVPALRDATADMLEGAKSRFNPVIFRRARHVIGEIERTVRAADEVRKSNWPAVGTLMYASHASLRDDYGVSCSELDAVVEIAASIGAKGGVIGCRMTGGGFGGCTVALVQTKSVASISEYIAAEYERRTKIIPSLFVSRPAAGATVLKS